MNSERLLTHFDRIAEAPDAVPRLRLFILDLAVRGKLVEQDPNDEPVAELLKRIKAEKVRLAKEGEIKSERLSPPIEDDEILFELPSAWCWTRLNAIASYIQRGKSPTYAAHDGFPVVSQKCVQWTGFNLAAARLITRESLETYEDIRFLRNGDLLWNSTGTGTIGRTITVRTPPPKLVCDSHVTVVRCLEVMPEYVHSWLRSDHVYGTIEDRAAGATKQVELTSQIANDQVLPLPPLAEQHRIVAKVDELMALCDRLEAAQNKREQRRDRLVNASLQQLQDQEGLTPRRQAREDNSLSSLASLAPWRESVFLRHIPRLTTRPEHIKALRQTILSLAVCGRLVGQDPNDEPIDQALHAALDRRASLIREKKVRQKKHDDLVALTKRNNLPASWTVERLGNLVDPENTISYGVLVPGNEVADGIPFVRAQDLALNSHPERPNKSIAPEIEKAYARTRLQGGEILLCVVGSIGKLGVAPPSWAGANIARAVARILPIPEVLRDYLLIVLQAKSLQTYFTEATRTLAQPTLNVGLIEQAPVPLPPLAEQHRIVAKVDDLMALCDQLEANLTTTQTDSRRLLEAVLRDALA